MLKLSFIQEPALPGPFSQFSQSTYPTYRGSYSVLSGHPRSGIAAGPGREPRTAGSDTAIGGNSGGGTRFGKKVGSPFRIGMFARKAWPPPRSSTRTRRGAAQHRRRPRSTVAVAQHRRRRAAPPQTAHSAAAALHRCAAALPHAAHRRSRCQHSAAAQHLQHRRSCRVAHRRRRTAA